MPRSKNKSSKKKNFESMFDTGSLVLYRVRSDSDPRGEDVFVEPREKKSKSKKYSKTPQPSTKTCRKAPNNTFSSSKLKLYESNYSPSYHDSTQCTSNDFSNTATSGESVFDDSIAASVNKLGLGDLSSTLFATKEQKNTFVYPDVEESSSSSRREEDDDAIYRVNICEQIAYLKSLVTEIRIQKCVSDFNIYNYIDDYEDDNNTDIHNTVKSDNIIETVEPNEGYYKNDEENVVDTEGYNEKNEYEGFYGNNEENDNEDLYGNDGNNVDTTEDNNENTENEDFTDMKDENIDYKGYYENDTNQGFDENNDKYVDGNKDYDENNDEYVDVNEGYDKYVDGNEGDDEYVEGYDEYVDGNKGYDENNDKYVDGNEGYDKYVVDSEGYYENNRRNKYIHENYYYNYGNDPQIIRFRRNLSSDFDLCEEQNEDGQNRTPLSVRPKHQKTELPMQLLEILFSQVDLNRVKPLYLNALAHLLDYSDTEILMKKYPLLWAQIFRKSLEENNKNNPHSSIKIPIEMKIPQESSQAEVDAFDYGGCRTPSDGGIYSSTEPSSYEPSD